MLILLAILLLLLIPLVMLGVYWVRPRFSIQGFLVTLGVLATLPVVYFARQEMGASLTLLEWQPASLLQLSPSLLVDQVSWSFSLALVSLTLTLVITSIAQLGQSAALAPAKKSLDQGDPDPRQDPSVSSTASLEKIHPPRPTWQSWAGILVLSSFGLAAVTSGNMLTLLLAWAALDLIELLILMGQVLESKVRERVALAFAARLAGIFMIFMGAVSLWSRRGSLSFADITSSVSIYFILAAGLRLGVLPLHLPFTQEIELRRGLGTALRLVPAASSFILLVRVASVGMAGIAVPILLILVALAGLFAGRNWLRSSDELNGRPFWLLGCAAMAIASAVLKLPQVCLAWSIACLLSGGLQFSSAIHHRNLLPIMVLGLFNFSFLPFSPTWQAVFLFDFQSASAVLLVPSLFYFFSILFLIIQSLLLAGFVRHYLHALSLKSGSSAVHIEPWVWFLYPAGLFVVTLAHLIIGITSLPALNSLPVFSWVIGPLTIILGGMIYFFNQRYSGASNQTGTTTISTPLDQLLSLQWLYRWLWVIFRALSRLFGLFSSILEGDGGLLWALVLFALIFVFLQK